MRGRIWPRMLAAVALSIVLSGHFPALAQTAAKPPEKADKADKADKRSGPLAGFGTNSKEPIRIQAARLDVFDKEQRAVYVGDVVAVQGKTTLRCSKLTIFYEQQKPAGPQPASTGATGSNKIKKLDCDGPVSVVSCTQTATGDHGVYESAADTVTLTGNVVLADGENIQNGDKLVYNVGSGVAQVTGSKPGARVGGIFVPGSDAAKKQGAPGKGAAAPPKAANAC